MADFIPKGGRSSFSSLTLKTQSEGENNQPKRTFQRLLVSKKKEDVKADQPSSQHGKNKDKTALTGCKGEKKIPARNKTPHRPHP